MFLSLWKLGKTTFEWSKKLNILIFSFGLQTGLFAQNPDLTSTAEEYNHRKIADFLTVLAEAESDQQWHQVIKELNLDFPQFMQKSSTQKTLNQLKANILKSDDLELIKLFMRAVRNHDTLSSEKADPVPSYYNHYQSPSFFVPDIHLTLDVRESQVFVTTNLTIKRNSHDSSLVLDGKDHQVEKISINGKLLPKEFYKVTPHELILLHIPEDDNFQVKIESRINPFTNDSLEGMYLCGQWLTTQCESEGARRIFYTLDRPDVLSRFTTTIIADEKRYPYRLSNGDFVKEQVLEDGRSEITWHDPFPKPSYLFACVLGHFSRLTGHFKTKSGKDVELQVYVEPGKESRVHYALFALKKAMEFDEKFFDREYDLSCLKMVAIPDFNSGAMENKGLMIFNDVRLLVDDQSGTDKSHRDAAHVIAHEYFHNWSGNRVTVRNWFEIALKEAFTDLRAMLFSEWLFGAEFIRPKAVRVLQENQFPEESSEEGHPIMVESYVDAHSIYDQTTYTKGREVFRALKNYIDMCIPDGFKEVQNLYFSRYDGQAVTFRELLSAGNEVLERVGKDLSLFERWFHQRGTPIIQVDMDYDEEKKIAELTVRQSCPHPQTGKEQDPFQIPFSYELLGKEGIVLCPKSFSILENESTTFKITSPEKPTPLFMHGYTAPVILRYDYSLEDLACIVKYTDDAFCRWEAAQNYSIMAFKEMVTRINADSNLEIKNRNDDLKFKDLHQLYAQALENPQLSPLAKAQILEIPSLRALSQAFDDFDFERLHQLRSFFIRQLALACKPSLEQVLKDYSAPSFYEPDSEQMQIRELRHASLSLLVLIDETYQEKVLAQYKSATNFEDTVSAFNLCLSLGGRLKEFVIADFYNKWKTDKGVFNFWLSSQALSADCSVEDLRKLESVEGYDAKNPNHVRSILRTFVTNLHCYHHSSGEGYQYIVDKIVEISKFNPLLAHNYIAVPAFIDFEKLPAKQQALMAKELERLLNDQVPSQTRDLVQRMLLLRRE
jgi:aminopeptidase N